MKAVVNTGDISLNSILRNTKVASVSQSQSRAPKTQDSTTDAAILDISKQATKSDLRTDVARFPVSGELSETNIRNEAILATLSPGLVRKYNKLLNLVLNDHERLQNFIRGVSQVIDQVDSKAPASKTNASNESLNPIPKDKELLPLAVGHQVSFTVSGHLDAAFAAAGNGPVLTRKLALEVTSGLEGEPQQIENEDDPLLFSANNNTKNIPVGI